jgi:hypothetical protein
VDWCFPIFSLLCSVLQINHCLFCCYFSSGHCIVCIFKKVEDTKGVIRIRKSKKDIMAKRKRTNNDLQNTMRKSKDRTTRTSPFNVVRKGRQIFLH